MFFGEYICEKRGNEVLLPEEAGVNTHMKWVLLQNHGGRSETPCADWEEMPGAGCEEIMGGREEVSHTEPWFLRIVKRADDYFDEEMMEKYGLSLIGAGPIQLNGSSLVLPEAFLRYLAGTDEGDSELVLLGCGVWVEIRTRENLRTWGTELGYK